MIWKNEKENLENLIFNEKLSYDAIGEKYGCSGSNIRKQAKKLGILLPKRREINESETFGKGVKRELAPNKICPICGGKKSKEAKMCKECSDKQKMKVSDFELGYYIGYEDNRQTYTTTKCNMIRRNARQFMEKESKQEKVCAYCHNHEFDEILEVHHLKSITSFDPHTKIKDINNDSNLVWLCPNHHTMLEKGLIQL